MTVLGNAVGNVIVTGVVTWTLNRRTSLACKLLHSLTSYSITSAGVEAAKPEVQAAVQRLTKQQAAKARKQEADLGDAVSVSAIPVSAQRVQATSFYEYLDSVVSMLSVAAANFLVGVVYQLFQQPLNFFPALFATFAICQAIRALFAVNLLSRMTPTSDKAFSIAAAVVSGAAALTLLLKAPEGLLALDTNAASAAFSQATGSLMRSKAATPEAQHMEDPTLPPVALKAGLSLTAAVLGGILLTAMIRVTRSFLSAAADRPGWARKQQHLAFSSGTKALLNVNLVLPGLAAIIWVIPLVQEPLELSTTQMPIIKAAALTAVALAQLLSTRPVVQAYLNTGLIQWHQLKHGNLSGAMGKKGNIIKRQLDIINALFVKVAVQCAAPPVILLGCAIILLQPTAGGTLVSGGTINATEMLQIPMIFWQCIADFTGWWSCLCCFTFSAGSYPLLRSALLKVT